MIAAVDNNWAIGKDNKLLISIPADMKFFRQETTGHVIVMGRKTLESFPQGRPLPNRRNIVLSSNPSYQVKDAEVVHSVEELKELLKDVDTDEVFVIGGQSIYTLLEPLCDTAYITKIDYSYEADAFFPNLDENPAWTLYEEGEEETCFDIIYHFDIYKRN